jgi:hypothetical protein
LQTTRVDLSDFEHVTGDKLRCVLVHWLDLRGAKLLPAKRDIDATAIPSALPYIAIHQHMPDGSGFLCRLVGEEIYSRGGRGMRGRRLSESLPGFRPLEEILLLALDHQAIVHRVGHFSFGGIETPAESLVLPFDGDTSARFAVHVFVRKTRAAALASETPDGMDIVNTMTPACSAPGASRVVSTRTRMQWGAVAPLPYAGSRAISSKPLS